MSQLHGQSRQLLVTGFESRHGATEPCTIRVCPATDGETLLEVAMLQALRNKPQPRWPERALSNAFVRNVAKAGRYCDGRSGKHVNN